MRGNPLDFIPYILGHHQVFLNLLSQHIQLTVVSVLLGILVAIPLAVLASRLSVLAGPMTWLAGVGQTIPSLAILGLALPLMGIGFLPSLIALTIRAVLPIFLNTYVGINGADRAMVDAARGVGMSGRQRLLLVELPLATPVIFAGIRTAIVQNVGIATLAAFIGGGGLGDLILQGLSMVDPAVLLAGAIPIAVLAMAADMGMGYLSRIIVPAGLQEGTS